jgi:hypothetical protein
VESVTQKGRYDITVKAAAKAPLAALSHWLLQQWMAVKAH